MSCDAVRISHGALRQTRKTEDACPPRAAGRPVGAAKACLLMEYLVFSRRNKKAMSAAEALCGPQ